MSEKRYFERKWEGEYYIFDSQVISEKEFDEKVEYEDYQAFADSMTGEEVTDRLNKYNKEYLDCHNDVLRLEKENEQLKSENNLLRTNVGKLTDDVKYLQNLPSTHQKENNQLKSRINDLEWILGIRSDITPVYWGDRNFNCCILDLIGNGRQKSVLNYLYDHYRKNDYEIKDFDNILREHGVKYGKYGWEKER